MGLWSKIFGKNNKTEQPNPSKPASSRQPQPVVAPANETVACKVEAPKPAPASNPDPEVNIAQLNRELHDLPMADLMKAAFMGMAHAYGDQITKAMENPNLEERVKGIETVEALMPTAVQFLGEYDKATVILRKMLVQAKRENERSKTNAAPPPAIMPAPVAPTVGGPRKLTPKNPT